MVSEILNGDQSLYLQTIFDYFQKEGKWPTHKYLERLFIRTHPDLDIEELIKTLPPGLTNPVNLNDANSKAYLTVPAVYLCQNSARILGYFLRLIKHCVEIFFNADVTEPQITSEEIATLYSWGEMPVREVGLLFQTEPNIWSTFGYNDSNGSWSGVISKGIRRFRNLQTIEQYLEMRDSTNPASSNPPYTFTEELQVESSSAGASNAAPEVANTQYIPRAFGGTLVVQTKQEELQADNPSASASQVAPQVDNFPGVDNLPGSASNAAPEVVNFPETPSTVAPQVKNPSGNAGDAAVAGNVSQTAPQVDNRDKQTEQIEIAIRALTDTPSKVDLLGFTDYATGLADFIKSEKTQKPLTIVVDAPWGMGKTTLMDMIRTQLEDQEEKTTKK